MSKTLNPAERAEVLRQLDGLCSKVPTSFQRWSYQTTVDFKQAAAAANAARKSSRVSIEKLRAHVNAMSGFHSDGREP